MRESKVINVLAGLAILAAAGSVAYTRLGGAVPPFDPRPHEAAGWAMAHQTIPLLKPGGQIVILARDTEQFKNPATEVQLAAFRKEVDKAHAVIGSIQTVQVDPLRPVEVPSGDFTEWIRKTPKGSVIASFMGPPILSQAQRSRLGEIRPGIVAFCSGNVVDRVDLRTLFGQGLLQAAVVSRANPLSSPAKPRGRQGWFDHSFVVVNATNVGQSPWLAGATSQKEAP